MRKPISYKDERVIKQPNYTLPNAVICDLDGTVALRTGRSPFDYTKVKTDMFDPRMRDVLQMYIDHDVYILFVTGRADTCRKDCMEWIEKHLDDIAVTKLSGTDRKYELYMRKAGDFRKDWVAKKELYDNFIKDKYNVMAVFEDRTQVVDMWREEGLLTFQVDKGDF